MDLVDDIQSLFQCAQSLVVNEKLVRNLTHVVLHVNHPSETASCNKKTGKSTCGMFYLSLWYRLTDSSSFALKQRRRISLRFWWFFSITLNCRPCELHKSGKIEASPSLFTLCWFCEKAWKKFWLAKDLSR